MKRVIWLSLFVLHCGDAYAASEEAWAEFRKKVESACLDLVSDRLQNIHTLIDPFGSASFGLAVVTGTPPQSDKAIGFICVHDKITGRTEVGGELDLQPALEEFAR